MKHSEIQPYFFVKGLINIPRQANLTKILILQILLSLKLKLSMIMYVPQIGHNYGQFIYGRYNIRLHILGAKHFYGLLFGQFGYFGKTNLCFG